MAVALGTFMTYLDNNVVNVALPSIQRDLHLSISGLEWIASAYILVFAGLLLAGGRLADVLGMRGAFLAGLAIFTLASVGAGLAQSQEMLIGARAVQGIGAALLTPASLALLARAVPGPARARHGGRRLGRRRRARPRGRPADRRLAEPARLLGLDLPDQRADRRGHRGARAWSASRPAAAAPPAASTCPAWSPRRSRCSPSPTR